jgi:hypothetical protein
MSYSRRELYALGEPLGESVTRREGGRIVYGGGGGGGNTTSTQTSTTDLPEWARPYAKDILSKGQALSDINQNPYQTYGGERVAGFTDMQRNAMTGAQNMTTAPQLGAASGMAGMAGLNALGTNYNPAGYNAQTFGSQMGGYMSPYMQNVVDIQQREAQRQGDIAGTQRNAQAVQAGAFGGSRQAIMDAEAARNLAMQKGDIQATGLQNAFNQAQNQYNTTNQLNEQSRQYGAGLGMQGLQTALQSANTLGQLGGQQFQQGMDINKLQSAYGGMQQGLNQQQNDINYQNFQNQQNYPYKQLGFMSDLLRGTPTGSSSTTNMYTPPGSTLGQLAGIGTGIYGLSKFMADGGEVKSYAEGGVTSQGNVESIIQKLSDQQLQTALQNAQARNDMATMQAIQQELAMRASEKQGMAGAFNMLPQEQQDETVNAAGGGIIAFSGEDDSFVVDPMGTGASETINTPYEPTGMTGLQKLLSRVQNEPEWKIKEAEAKALKEATAKKTKPSAPAAPTANRPQPKGSGARSTPAYVALDEIPPAPKKDLVKQYADLSDSAGIPKPSPKFVKSAVEELAEKNNLNKSEEDALLESTEKILNRLEARDKPSKDKLNKDIEDQKPDIEGMRQRGIGQALADFGFKWAAAAAKPGARFLESGAEASPALGAAAAKMQEAETLAKQNYAKLRLDQTKYEVALQKGNMQLAATTAGQIRQGQQADKTLQFQIAKAKDELEMEKAKLAQTGAYYNSIAGRQPENVMSLARQLMQDPAFKGTQNDAIEKAAYLLKGGVAAGIRGETASAANLDKALKDIDANIKYQMLTIMDPSNPKYASLKAAYDAERRAAYVRHGNAGISGAVPAASNDGFGPMKVR